MWKIGWLEKKNTHTTVGTVCATTLLGCLVHLDVLDDQIAGVETLGVCVCFGVLEQAKKEFGGLDGPAGTGDAELFTCCSQTCQSTAILIGL